MAVNARSVSPTILVVDDSRESRILLRHLLASEGFRVFTAADGETALSLCAAENVDLILLDVVMPGRGGLQVCADLKSDPATSDIPVIFVSALDASQDRVAGFDAGGVDYIPKPVFAKEVLARVRVHLRLRQAEDALRQQRAWLDQLQEAQQSMLVTPEDFPEASFAVDYRAADVVGGDIYDVIPLSGERVGYFVADVSGHGVGASYLTAAIKAMLRMYANPMFTLEDIMRNMNSVLLTTMDEGRYLTACYARLSGNRRKLTVISAGHPPMVLVSPGGEGRLVEVSSDPLGVFGSVVLHKQDVEVKPGDRFYLYTDGLIEDSSLPGGGRSVGLNRLRAACARYHDLSLDSGVHAIVSELKPSDGPVEDDLLLMGVEVRA